MDVNLKARGLRIGYPGRTVGRDIDLEVHKGEVFCLLGPNGSGKTTLFKTLLGLLPAQEGSVEVGGRPLDGMSRRQIARSIAYVPQAHAPPFPYSVIDVVLMGRTTHLGVFASPSDHDRETARTALATLGIADLADHDYSRVSGGQRQLVLVARALAQESPLLIMDEPAASLDFGNQARVLSETLRLARTGLSVILSTHDPDHAFAVASTVALLDNGRINAVGAPDAVLTGESLSRIYGTDVAVERLSSGRPVSVPRFEP